MLHQLAAARSPRPVWWLHGARNGAELPFAAEVRQLLAQLPEARSRICFSRPLPPIGAASTTPTRDTSARN
ncbi:hypothetical protein ACFQZC_36120 [Streptacidiphilus monticola]